MTIAKILKRRATREERKVATDLGGRRVPLSGAGLEKGDVVVPGFRVEVKTTAKNSYTLSAKDWSDVVRSALKAGQSPLFHISLERRLRLVVMTAATFAAYFHPVITTVTNEGARSFRITTSRWRDALRLVDDLDPVAVPHISLRIKAPTPQTQFIVIMGYEEFCARVAP